MASSSGPVLNPGADQYYQQQLGLNVSNYNQILGQFTQAQNNASSQLADIYSGYGSLSQSVLDALGVSGGGWGVAAPAQQQIQRQYELSQGRNQQALINAGLGNSTLLSNVMNQGTLQYGQAIGNLGAQLSQTAAGYMSQIGLAGLGARQQGVNQQLGLSSNLMGVLGRYNFAPNVPLYGQQSFSDAGGGGGGGGGGYRGGYGGGGMGPSPVLAAAANTAYGAFHQGNNMGYSGGYHYGGGGYNYGGGGGGQLSFDDNGGGMDPYNSAMWNLAESSPNWSDPGYFNSAWNLAESGGY